MLIFKKRGKYVAPHGFAQRACLPQRGRAGASGACLLSQGGLGVRGRCPGPFSGLEGWGECITPRAGVMGAARVRSNVGVRSREGGIGRH